MKRIGELELEYVKEVLENSFKTSLNSVFTNRLESSFAELFDVPYAVAHINGTATLHTALAALNIKQGDEVIVPPLTMSSPSLAVLQNGSVPVFADVDIRTFTINPDDVDKQITEKTRAVMPVSLYGLAPDYDNILKICKSKQIPVIEDNAECFLGTYKGRLVGTFGDFASFSFQASKHLTSGEGGMLITRSETLANEARRFSSLGYAGVNAKQGKISRNDIQDPNYSRHVSLGFNYRMSEIQAALALAQLQRADELVRVRQNVAELFDKAIEGSDLIVRQYEPEGLRNSYWSYSCVLKTDKPGKDWYAFRDLFQNNGGDGFYAAWKLTYHEPLFTGYIQNVKGVHQKYEPGLCPNAEYLQPRMIQMKTNYWDLTEAEHQAEILYKTIKQF
ncbi:MAG: DegT/DnrJ/EryC1/StrS family aminotransferase [Bacteroidales bacterium]